MGGEKQDLQRRINCRLFFLNNQIKDIEKLFVFGDWSFVHFWRVYLSLIYWPTYAGLVSVWSLVYCLPMFPCILCINMEAGSYSGFAVHCYKMVCGFYV